MAVKIRLTRVGKKHQPIFRIVTCDEAKKRNGSFLEVLGLYNPRTEEKVFGFKKDRYQYWLEQGAQPTERVRRLVKLIS